MIVPWERYGFSPKASEMGKILERLVQIVWGKECTIHLYPCHDEPIPESGYSCHTIEIWQHSLRRVWVRDYEQPIQLILAAIAEVVAEARLKGEPNG